MVQVVDAGQTGNADVNGLLIGSKWASLNLTYSFPANGSFYGPNYAGANGQNVNGFQQLTASQQDTVRDIYGMIASVTKLTFTEITETSTQHATLRLGQSSQPISAESYYPSIYNADGEAGDSWFGTRKGWYEDTRVGGYAMLTFMHEMELALGVKDDIDGTALPYQYDSMEYSVSTYRSHVGGSVMYGYSNEQWGFAQSLMAYDILALQTLYGANYDNAGVKTVYSWDPNTGEKFINGVGQGTPGGNKIFMTVWDGSSNATYDFSNYATDLKVDLRPGQWTTVSTAQLADLGSYNGAGQYMAAGNIANAFLYNNDTRSLIREAIGGSGNDTIIGNDANNSLIGGGGNDTITGGAGNDTTDGGTGTDTAVFSGKKGDYTFSNVGGVLKVTDIRSGRPDGVDLLKSVEQLKFADGTFSVASLGLKGPQVSVTTVNAVKAQELSVASLVSTATSGILKYQLWQDTNADSSGHFVVDGVSQGVGQAIDVSAGQFASAKYVTGLGGSDVLWVRAFDGIAWGSWAQFNVNTANAAPTLTAVNVTATKGQAFAAPGLFTFSDADGDRAVRYEFKDATANPTSGNFVLGDVAQAANTTIAVTADQLSSLTFQSKSGADTLMVRAYDGAAWSGWTTVTVTAPINTAPKVLVGSVGSPLNFSIDMSQLVSASDADAGDQIVKYQFWDETVKSTSGYFMVNGLAQASGVAIDVNATDLASTIFHTGTAANTDVLWVRATDGITWGDWQKFTVTAPAGPMIMASNQIVQKGVELAASTLFTSITPNFVGGLDSYQLWDGTAAANSGHFTVNGVAQGAGYAIDVSADQLANTKFQTGLGTVDNLWVRGQANGVWSDWVSFTISAPNHAPTVSASDVHAAKFQAFDVASLFNGSDSDGDSIVGYQFWDSTAGASTGHFMLSGKTLAENQAITITGGDLANVSFQSGSGADQLWVRITDGITWSDWASFNAYAPVNNAPQVQVQNVVSQTNHVFAASALFSSSDLDGDTIQKYQFWDGGIAATSGHFEINGLQQQAGVAIDVAAGDLSHVNFVTGEVAGASDQLWVRAFDGLTWGDWRSFSMTVPTGPVMFASDHIVAKGVDIDASSLFSLISPTGNAPSAYQFWDSTKGGASGHFAIDGVTQAAGIAIDVTAGQLSSVTFHSASNGGSDQVWVRSQVDGVWSNWVSMNVIAPNHAPNVGVASVTAAKGEAFALSSLFSTSDSDGDAITGYQIWDSTVGENSGRFMINGQAAAENKAIDVSPADLANTVFQSGSGTDQLWIRATDGTTWSVWKSFEVSAPMNKAPTVAVHDITLLYGQSVAAASLVTANDVDGDSIQKFQFWDDGTGVHSGHFTINSVAQGTGQAIDVLATDLDHVSFVAGSADSSETLWVRANDGLAWGEWKSFSATSHA